MTDREITQRATDVANILVDRKSDPLTWLGIRTIAVKLLNIRNQQGFPEWATEEEAREQFLTHHPASELA